MELGFTEPYLLDKNIAVGVDLFRRDLNQFNFTTNGDRNQLYNQVSTGFQIRTGVPLTEYWSLSGRYGLSYDEVGLDESLLVNGRCPPASVGRYLCEALGNRWTSSIGYSLIYNSLNSGLRPTAGTRFSFSQDFAGLGGDVKYIRTRAEVAKYYGLGSGFVLSFLGEGSYIKSLEKSRGPGIDKVRIIDRFYLGEPNFRGFDIRGVGPRIRREFFTDGTPAQTIIANDNQNQNTDDPLGGRAYYLGRAELEIPLGSGARELGLRPSIYVQAGSLFGLTRPLPATEFPTLIDPATGKAYKGSIFTPILSSTGQRQYTYTTTVNNVPTTNITSCDAGIPNAAGTCIGTVANPLYQSEQTPFQEVFLGNSARPRLTIGIGVNWNSPFGPLRIDLAKALIKQKGDDNKLITFNVGTQF